MLARTARCRSRPGAVDDRRCGGQAVGVADGTAAFCVGPGGRQVYQVGVPGPVPAGAGSALRRNREARSRPGKQRWNLFHPSPGPRRAFPVCRNLSFTGHSGSTPLSRPAPSPDSGMPRKNSLSPCLPLGSRILQHGGQLIAAAWHRKAWDRLVHNRRRWFCNCAGRQRSPGRRRPGRRRTSGSGGRTAADQRNAGEPRRAG
jgi:hypothetical protein